mgnify:CR=1 FL=1
MTSSLYQFLLHCSYLVMVFLCGVFLYRIARGFLSVRPRWWWKLLLAVCWGCSSAMIIWVGDPNLFYTFPFFLLFSLLSTQGDWVGRLAVTVIFFCLIMSVCAMADTYLSLLDHTTFPLYDILSRLARPLAFTLIYLFLCRRLPQETVVLSRRLWRLVLGLSLMPLFALVAEVLLAYPQWMSPTAHAMALKQGLVLLPFSGITAIILLLVILALSNHEQLEREVYLAGLRELYYQGLQREHTQVRTLRHDLRNHLTAVQGLLAQGEGDKAAAYLSQLAASPSLSGEEHFCDNTAANVVLAAKAQEMGRRGLMGQFQVALPQDLSMRDIDLCALLGNALDNAIEAAGRSSDKTILVRCRADKGLFMLRVENALAGDERADLSTTKRDSAAHGFGLPGMREIARRYGGSLEATAANGRFELVVCLPL